MAKVYLALMAGPAGFSKLLVLKVLREDLLAGSAQGVQMFWEEARLAARLSHPNIVQTLEVGEFEGRYFIAMEYLDGQPYSALLRHAQNEPIAVAEHLRIASLTARALHYLHTLKSYQGESQAIVHRDVSPHNIIVTYDGQVKLLDFGVATTEDPEHVTRIGLIKGKLDYIAPEQLRGETLDGGADIFALGAVLWEAVAGKRFAGGRKVADAIKIQTRLIGGERRIREVVPAIAPELERIIEQAVALDPSQRFRDAGEFADAIDAYLGTLGARPSEQSLAQILDPVFTTERSQTHALIDEQLQAAKRAPGPLGGADWTKSLPYIAPAPSDEGSSLHPIDARYGTDLSQRSVRPKGLRPSSVVGPRSGRMLFASAAAIAAGAAVALAFSGPSTDARPMVVDAPVLLPPEAAAKLGAAAVTQDHTPEQVATPEKPLRSPELEKAVLQIDVSPASAAVTIDGAAVKTPFSGQFRKDSSLHMVEVSAEGFRTSKQLVKLERDQRLVISLSRIATAARRASTSEQRGPAQVPAPLISSSPASAPAKTVVVPGADIELLSPPARGDDIYQVNPYRSSR